MEPRHSDIHSDCKSVDRASILSLLSGSDPVSALLQMLSLKVIDLSIRLEKLQDTKEQRDDKWGTQFLDLFSTVSKSKHSTRCKPLLPLYKYLKIKKAQSTVFPQKVVSKPRIQKSQRACTLRQSTSCKKLTQASEVTLKTRFHTPSHRRPSAHHMPPTPSEAGVSSREAHSRLQILFQVT